MLYELPEVKEEMGYRPGPYIAAVSRRREGSFGPGIRPARRQSWLQIRRARVRTAGLVPEPGPGPGSPGQEERR